MRLHEKNRGMAAPLSRFKGVEPGTPDFVEKSLASRRPHDERGTHPPPPEYGASSSANFPLDRGGNFVAKPWNFQKRFLPYVDRNIEKRIEKEIMKHASFSKGELDFP